MLGRFVACIIAVSLVLPSNVALAQPAQTDRDLDGVSDDVDSCPDVYGAPPSGCPPQAPPPPADRDFDGVPDERDACPDQGAPTSSGCPDAPPPVEAPPPQELPPALEVDPSDEYQQLLRTLPNDYDLQYKFDAQTRKRKKENDPGVAAKRLRGLGIAGSSLLLVGAVGLITTLSTGLVMAKNAKEDLEGTDGTSFDPLTATQEREDALKKGEQGDKVAIIGSAASGGLMALGAALLLGARSLRKKTYGASSGGGGGGSGMTDKTKRNLTIYGALLLLYGLIGVAAGAVLAKRDDPKKAKNGKILLGIGGAMAGLGLLMFIPLAINKFKKTSRINAGPMWVRGGAGAGLRINF
jgi:hypothetical protein